MERFKEYEDFKGKVSNSLIQVSDNNLRKVYKEYCKLNETGDDEKLNLSKYPELKEYEIWSLAWSMDAFGEAMISEMAIRFSKQ